MSDYLLTVAARLDREPDCTCVETDRGTDTLGCPTHDPVAVQWACDHLDGEIADDEALAMCEYSAETDRCISMTAAHPAPGWDGEG